VPYYLHSRLLQLRGRKGYQLLYSPTTTTFGSPNRFYELAEEQAETIATIPVHSHMALAE
jgi:hypothetical protein